MRGIGDIERGGIARWNIAKEDIAKEDIARRGIARRGIAREDFAAGDIVTGDIATGDIVREDAAMLGTMTKCTVLGGFALQHCIHHPNWNYWNPCCILSHKTVLTGT